MKSKYDILGNHIRLIDTRNRESITDRVLGINIDKFFMPSVANVIGTDLSKYKLITKGKFACNPMHVGRDERLPVALYDEEEPAIVSPAYFMFEVVDNSILNEDYLMMWFRRPEFDRICWLHTDGSVRGGITWDDICRLELPIPPIEKQLEIVNSYKAITERIALKQKINDNLASTAQSLYKEWFVDFGHCSDKQFQSTKIGDIPIGWSVKNLTDLMSYAGGQQPPASEFIHEPREGYIRLVQIRDYETDAYATYIPIASKNKICDDHDIMIARYGVSLGRICYGLNGAYNVALAKVTPYKPFYKEFLRCFLNTDTFYNGINGSGERSAQQGFNQGNMEAFDLAVPPDNVLIEFEKLVKPLFEHRLFLRNEIAHLEDIRDTLISAITHQISSR